MMLLQDIVKNEDVEDVVTFLGLTSDYRKLDRLYTYSKPDVVISGELSEKYDELFRKGVLEEKNGKVIKGPNWKEPKFVTEKKYGIV
ncbi:TPA: immunity protein [Pseudomonas aeruginosa]|nr:immunity protein [Pseudomonas aeruginosa]ELP1298565.1 immunity protein [Pseudomonas aeruginosa]MBH9196131.1 immunity protein [Pseudomonas aeruginosa]MBO3691601.1 immunity protein [Pseudomonas aeruginosa]HBO3598797.1 immunity protein [Pseudomonas aeruginosa]